MSHKRAIDFLGGSKLHTKRRNSPTAEQVEQVGSWVCVICGESKGHDSGERYGIPTIRTAKLFCHADETHWLGAICLVEEPSGRGVGGCRRELMRVARGTRYGSARRLEQLKAYRDNPTPFEVTPNTVASDYDKRTAARLRSDGVQVTALEVAAFRVVAGDACQVCGRSATKEYPAQKRPVGLDHDHRRRKMRGWLCADCNGGMQFLDLAEPDRQEGFYANALWLFRDAEGVKGDPWYVKPPWFRTSVA
ncbi:endonuclease domain-containing protein [Actinomadura syzygii]|nr:endonuclease domain-containing protein [Actinomadura syzygii]